MLKIRIPSTFSIERVHGSHLGEGKQEKMFALRFNFHSIVSLLCSYRRREHTIFVNFSGGFLKISEKLNEVVATARNMCIALTHCLDLMSQQEEVSP